MPRFIITFVIVSVLLTSNVLSIQIPNTSVSLIPPDGFAEVFPIPLFVNHKTKSSINISDEKLKYDQVEAIYCDQNRLKVEETKLLGKSSTMVDGHSAILLHFEMPSYNARTLILRQWILVVDRTNYTTIIEAKYPKTETQSQEKPLKEAILGATFGKDTNLNLFDKDLNIRPHVIHEQNRHVNSQDQGIQIIANPQHQKSIESLSFTSDNKYLLTSSWDKTIKLWDIEAGRPIREFLGHKRGVNDAKISPDGKYVVSGDNNGEVFLWDKATGDYLYTITKVQSGSIRSIVFTPDNEHIIIAPYDARIELWNYKTKTRNHNLSLYGLQSLGKAYSLKMTNDKKYLIAAKDHVIEVLDLTSKKVITSMGHRGLFLTIATTNDSKYVLSGGADNNVMLWNIKTGVLIHTFKGHRRSISAITASPDGKYAVSGGFDSAIYLWDLESKKQLGSLFDSYYSNISALAYSPDGKKLFAAFDKDLLIWDFEKMRAGVLAEIPYGVASIDFTPDNNKILTGGHDGITRLWNLENGELIWSFTDLKGFINAVAISPDGKFAACAGKSGVVTLLDINTGTPVNSFIGLNTWIYDIQFSPDGKQLVSGSESGGGVVWDVSSGKRLNTLKHSDSVDRLTYSIDGSSILTFTWNEIFVWNKQSGKLTKSFFIENAQFFFTKQQSSFLSLGFNEGISNEEMGPVFQEWDFNTGEKIRDLEKADRENFYSINISPDNKFLVAGGLDGSIKLWDISSGKHIKTFLGHKDRVETVVFSPNNKLLASGSNDGSTKLWNISTGKEIISLLGITKSKWITTTPEGYYISSDSDFKSVSVNIGNQYFQIKQSARKILANQNIIKNSLKLGDSAQAVDETIGHANHLKNIEEIKKLYSDT